jgi:hypothetical protein
MSTEANEEVVLTAFEPLAAGEKAMSDSPTWR